jgi:hypothetical protein
MTTVIMFWMPRNTRCEYDRLYRELIELEVRNPDW